MRNALPAVAAFAIVLHLAGCDREPGSGSGYAPASEGAPIATRAAETVPAEASATPASTAPAATPASNTPAAMLQDWRAAMESHAFGRARSYFGNGGAASGMSEGEFARVWDKYKIIDMTIGEGRIEGAAGSLYYEVPVTITGLTREGRPYNLSGTVTARRVNDVPGATPDQLRWHIDSTSLNP